MEHITLSDTEYTKLSKAVFKKKNGSSDLGLLTNWQQPLNFKGSSDILNQVKGGPCGLFSVIQANLLHRKQNLKEGEYWDREEQLVQTILDIFARISPYYVFCVKWSSTEKIFEFVKTESREQARDIMRDFSWLENDWACLNLTISLVFASVKLSQLDVPGQPYIEFDRNTTVALVWLIINGTTSSESVSAVENSGNYMGSGLLDIGLKVLRVRQKNLIGTWLNPSAQMFVCLIDCHFFTVIVKDNNLVVCDNLAQSNKMKVLTPDHYKDIHWH